jgi:hypothetical protein
MGWSRTAETNKEGGEKKWTALDRDKEKDGVPDPSVSISISLKESNQL